MTDIPLTEDAKTFAWLDALCEAAITNARNGDKTLADRIGSNPVLKLYLDNVYPKNITPQTWATFAGYLEEATRLRTLEESEAETERRLTESDTRLSAIETKQNDMDAKMDKLIAYFEEQAAKNKKPGKASKEQSAEGDEAE